MTPNLVGRWQTRLFLLGFIGGLLGLIFVWRYFTWIPVTNRYRWIPEYVIGYLILFGFVWDCIYQFITEARWEYDWPAAFYTAQGIFEGAVVYLLIKFTGLPLIPRGSVNFHDFIIEYAVIWCVTYAFVFLLMRAFFPRWRFHQARFGRYPFAAQ